MVAEPCSLPAEHIYSFLNRHLAITSQRRNAEETKLDDGCGVEKGGGGFRHAGDPSVHSGMMGVIRPSPCHHDVDIKQIVHGKSESISFTDSLVRGM